MKHIAFAVLIAALSATLSSCATNKEGLPVASGPLADSKEADKAIVCRFGKVRDGDADEKKGCTTPNERQDKNPVQDISPVDTNPEEKEIK